MKKGFLRIVACVLTLMIALTSVGSGMFAFAADEAAKQEKVLIVTQDMVNGKGSLTVSGEWDRIIVPKEIEASNIFFRNVKAGVVEIESGVNRKVEMVSGEVGEVAVVPAKLTEMTIQDLCDLIKESGDSVAALKLYEQVKEQNGKYQNQRPTVVTSKEVTVETVCVSGNAKLDFKKGNVENVKVETDGTRQELNVDISNFNGNVSIKQEENEDGKWMIARVKLKNSSVENLVMEGEGKGSIVLDGQKSEVKEVKVESSASVTLDVPAEKVEVPENAEDVKLTVLNKVEDMQISAEGTKVEVGSCGTVTNATVDSDDVTISGDGKVSDVEINSNGAAVSTQGTKVEGVNTYVPPVVSTPTNNGSGVRDLGGLQIIVGDHWSPEYPSEPTTPEAQALQAYREEMMEKHNFTIKQVRIADWGEMKDASQSSIMVGDPLAQVFVLDYRFVTGGTNLFYDLSTLSELDFSEDKWSDVVREQMSYNGGIYGMAADTGSTSEVGGIIYNKRLFEEAGLDPDLPYELQKNGQWTWSKFMEICGKLTRDTNNDGNTDVYALCSQSSSTLLELINSTGGQIIDVENGKFTNNLDSEEVLSALNFAQDLVDAGYEMVQPEGSNWDYFQTAFAAGIAAMQFNQPYMTSGSYSVYGAMEDELGFVCCPKPDGEESYHMWSYENIAVIPACYDAQTAADIAFAYNIWTNPVPGYEAGEDAWKKLYDEHNLDDRAINETLALYYEENIGSASYHFLLDENDDFSRDIAWVFPFVDTTPEKIIQEILPKWDAMVAAANTAKKPTSVAQRPDGSGSGVLKYPYSFTVNNEGTITVTKYRDSGIKELVLPERLYGRKITEIADRAFDWCQKLEKVELPKGLKRIGNWAFASAESLESVVIPEGVTEIGQYAFAYSTVLKSVTVPKSVTSIGEKAFIWPADDFVMTVEKDSYAESYALENGIAVAYMEDMEEEPEDNEEPEEEEELPVLDVRNLLYEEKADGTIKITDFVYIDSAVGDVRLPAQIDGKDVTEIGSAAFCQKGGFGRIVIPDTVQVIGERAFYRSTLTTVTIPKSVCEIGLMAFADCATVQFDVAEDSEYFTTVNGALYSKDKKVLYTVPVSLETECYDIAEGTKAIFNQAFTGCHTIKEITIPASVENIQAGAIEMCERVRGISVSDDNPYFTSYYGMLFDKDMKVLLRVPEHGGWDIPEGVEEIGERAYVYSSMEELAIPEGVKTIGRSAFGWCFNLNTVILPDSLERIYGDAFVRCWALENITLPSNLKEINGGVFSECISLTQLTIPDSVTMVDLTAFSGCTSLTEVVIPESVEWMINVPTNCPLVTFKVVEGSYADTYLQEKNLPVTYMGE